MHILEKETLRQIACSNLPLVVVTVVVTTDDSDGGGDDAGSICVVLCPEFVIPKDHQGAESDAKAKSLLRASWSSISYLHQRSGEMPGRESEFQKHKGFVEIMP